jgi:hypothetical protein
MTGRLIAAARALAGISIADEATDFIQEVRRLVRLSAIGLTQSRAFVHRDVVRLVALDFVLRDILAGAVHMSLVINVLQVDPDDRAAHISCFRIPGHVIANREPLCHEMLSFTASVMRLLNRRDSEGLLALTLLIAMRRCLGKNNDAAS